MRAVARAAGHPWETARRDRRKLPEPVALDAADLQIMELLAEDGRITNRAIAAKVGLTEATVAARIRLLGDHHVLGVTAVFDWEAAGYAWDFWVFVEVDGSDVHKVAEDITRLNGVHAVHMVLGAADIIVHGLATDRAAVIDFVSRQMGAVPGVRRFTTDITLKILKYDHNVARVPVRPEKLVFPDPAIDLDDLDHEIIGAVLVDGRRSNRELARNLSVSDGTIRSRIGRLEGAGMLRICGQTNPYFAGHLNSWAIVGVEVHTPHLDDVVAKLVGWREVVVLAVTSGQHDLLLFTACADHRELVGTVLNRVRALEGVRQTVTWDIVSVVRLDYEWARLL